MTVPVPFATKRQMHALLGFQAYPKGTCSWSTLLEVYHRPYDARYPQVCMDEGSKQLLANKREGAPREPGQPECYDNKYERHGTVCVLVACEPLGGKRVVTISKRRTKKDWAYAHA